MSFDPVQILNNLRKKNQAQVSVQPLGSNINVLNQFTTQSSLKRDNSNFDSFHQSQDVIAGAPFQTEEYASHRSHGSEFTINPTEFSSSRARQLQGFENTGFFRTEPESTNRLITKKLEFTPRVGTEAQTELFTHPTSSDKKENLILLEYAKKFHEVERKLQEQDEKLSLAYQEIHKLKEEKSELELKV
jgi:hypothetical protein